MIYVGTDDLLKAHATTGVGGPEIRRLLSKEATIYADEQIILPDNQGVIDASALPYSEKINSMIQEDSRIDMKSICAVISVCVLAIVGMCIVLRRQKERLVVRGERERMKRFVALVLVVALLFTGCVSQKPFVSTVELVQLVNENTTQTGTVVFSRLDDPELPEYIES